MQKRAQSHDGSTRFTEDNFTYPAGPGGGLGIFTDRDQRSIFLGFEFQESVFFWILVTAAVSFGLLTKSCIVVF